MRRARCVASRFSRSRSRRRSRARRAIAPASRANTTTTTATTSPVVARRRPPLRRPVYDTLSLETRDALATAAALAQRAARAGEAVNALLSDVGATLADELLWMSDQDAGPFGVVYAPLPDDADRNPSDAADRKPPPPPPSPPPPPPPYDFRARGPHDVSRRAVTFYWPALLRQPEPRVPRVGALVYRPVGAAARASAPFPVVAFGVGWNSWTERYDRTLTHLASHGFVVVSPTVADRRPDPASFGVLADHLRACLDWAARETRRSNAPLFGQIDPSRRGLFGHSSGAGAAARAATDATLAAGPGPGPGPSALAGVGAFSASAGVDLDALSAIRDVAVFQVAGQRDSHVTPRAVARLADAMARASPRVVAVVRDGTHCFLDEAETYAYPPSQCDAAREEEGVGGWRLLSPEAQMRVTREYLAAFFAGILGRDPKIAEEGRRKIFSFADEDDGARGAGKTRVREDTRLVVEPEEAVRGEVERGVTLRADPRMSRVEISTRGRRG